MHALPALQGRHAGGARRRSRAGANCSSSANSPGDKEDLAGKPFVGPAGRVLDQALEEAGIDRKDVFVTNAVKHFKFEQRGKRRLHKKPNAYEIERCNDLARYRAPIDQARGPRSHSARPRPAA